MQLKMYGTFPVECVGRGAVVCHTAPKDPKEWIVSQVINGKQAYPIIRGLDKLIARVVAERWSVDDIVSTDRKWWQGLDKEDLGVLIINMAYAVSDIPGIADTVVDRFKHAGKVVTLKHKYNGPLLLWVANPTVLPAYDALKHEYHSGHTVWSVEAFMLNGDRVVEMRTVPMVWVEEEMSRVEQENMKHGIKANGTWNGLVEEQESK